MLRASARLRRRAEVALTVRSGRRATGRAADGTPLVVVHCLDDGDVAAHAQVAFAVGRGVGGAVERNLVRRRLRHVVADLLAADARPRRLVVRALPASQRATFRDLAHAVQQALGRFGPEPARSIPGRS